MCITSCVSICPCCRINFWVLSSEFSAKNGPIATNRKQTYQLNSRPQTWSPRYTLAMTLTLNFQGHIWNLHASDKNGRIATKRSANNQLDYRPEMWEMGLTLAMTLSLNCQGQICYILWQNVLFEH